MDDEDPDGTSSPSVWTVPDLSARMDAMWELAAIARAWAGQPGDALAERAARVAQLHGFESGATTPAHQASVVAEIRSQLQLAAALAGGNSTPGWDPPDDATLQDQGRVSRRVAAIIAEDLATSIPELGRQLAEPGARFLDVGVGVAHISLGMCQVYPQLRCTGLDVNRRPLALAAGNIAAEMAETRVELRLQSFADLTDVDAFTLAWVPLPFLPSDVAVRGLQALLAALQPGGWVLAACHEPDADEKSAAMTWLHASIIGGNHFTSADTPAMLAELGYTDVSSPASPPGAPKFVLARRARS
jgi:SAM-dependent methyltransferase